MTKSLGSIAFGSLLLAVIFFTAAAMVPHGDNFGFDISPKGSSKTVTRQFAWDGGDRLEVNMPASVKLLPGGKPSVTVRGGESLMQHVTFTHGSLSGGDGDHCFISFLCGNSRGDNALQVEVHGVTLRDVEVNGVAEVNLGHLDQDRLDVRVSGASQIKADGRVNDLDLTISGAGEARMGQLAVANARVILSGAGEVRIAPSQDADVTISGIGEVKLSTKPARLTTHISGLGNVSGPGAKDDDDKDDDDAPARHAGNAGAALGKEISADVQDAIKNAHGPEQVEEKVREKLKARGLTDPDASSH